MSALLDLVMSKLSPLYDVVEDESFDESLDASYDNYEDDQNYYQETPLMNYQELEPAVTPITPMPTATVVMLSPFDIKTSQVVVDHIRDGHIVICNLTPCDSNQRVVDYISGGVYAFGGRIEPTPVKTTFVCTPANVDLVLDVPMNTANTKVSAI